MSSDATDASTTDRPPRPDPLDVRPEQIPDELTDRDQWVCWRYQWADRGEWTKVPVDPGGGGYASSTNADTWTSFASALAYHEREDTDTDGVGVVVHDEDLVVGLDLDDCRDPDTGDREAWADDVLDDVDTYGEVSPSETGLRLFGFGFLPDGGTRADVDDAEGHIEMYETGRYLTVTGHHIEDTPRSVERANDSITAVHTEYIADDTGEDQQMLADTDDDKTADPDPVDLDDVALLEKAKSAANGDKFRRLWRGDHSGYPSHSEADLALCGLLAFWTGGDRGRIDRLFRRSGLCREKWTDREDYRERTIDKALSGKSEFYDPGAREDRDADPGGNAADTNASGDGGDRDAGRLTWKRVRDLYRDPDVDTKYPRDAAYRLLREESTFATMQDTEEMHVYDPETGIYEPGGEAVIRERLTDTLGEQFTQHEASEILFRVQSATFRERDEFGADPAAPEVCVENGVLDLSELAMPGVSDPSIDFRDHSPDDLFLTSLPVKYDPDADCPGFHGFLGDVLDSDTDRQIVYEMLGYCLWPGYPFAKSLFLYGDGRNGKSTLIDVMERVLGTDNVSNRGLVEIERDRFAPADLFGSVANISGDLPDEGLEHTGVFKKLTGGDRVTADKKYKQPFTFENRAKLIFSANDPPKIKDDSTAMYRRLLLLNFPNEFTPPEKPGPDARPKHELLADIASDEELSGILNRALAALTRVFDRGEFSQTETVDQVRKQYKKVSDPIYAFAQECVQEDSDANVGKDRLYTVYATWARENDVPVKDKGVFARELGRHVRFDTGKIGSRGNRRRVYQGITLTSRGEQFIRDDDDGDSSQTGLV